MPHEAQVVVATAAGVLLLIAVALLVVRPLVRRLPWRIEQRRHPQGLSIELHRPGRPPQRVRIVPRGAEQERLEALREAEALRARLNAGEPLERASAAAQRDGSTTAV